MEIEENHRYERVKSRGLPVNLRKSFLRAVPHYDGQRNRWEESQKNTEASTTLPDLFRRPLYGFLPGPGWSAGHGFS